MSLSHSNHTESSPLLRATPIPFTYTVAHNDSGRPIQGLVTRYTPLTRPGTGTEEWSPRPIQCSILLVNAGRSESLGKEKWLPFINELYRISPMSPLYIRSIWTVEIPRAQDNHDGKAEVWDHDDKELAFFNYVTGQGSSTQAGSLVEHYTAAIRAFLASSSLSSKERNNLVGVGFGHAGSALVNTFSDGLKKTPFRSLILFQSTLKPEYSRGWSNVHPDAMSDKPRTWYLVADEQDLRTKEVHQLQYNLTGNVEDRQLLTSVNFIEG
ncbi:hypothetical protein M422DRAFT_784600, partial [Sphaerobolus stellatus SS14]